MLPENWPQAFQYSKTCICRDANERFFQEYLKAKNSERIPKTSFQRETKSVHPSLLIQKITREFVYNGPLPHPLAGQDVFEGHAQHGVFAKESILKKTFLGEYVGEVFLTKKGIEHSVSKQTGVYCWHLLFNHVWIYIYSGRIANELTFVNDFHGLGQCANVQTRWVEHNGFYYFGYETTRDIEPMEEILIDYQSKRLRRSG